MSLPSRECGLKSADREVRIGGKIVTPFAGVWIEIAEIEFETVLNRGHSLRGSVD